MVGRFNWLSLLIFFSVSMVACNGHNASKQIAENAAAVFHDHYNAKNFSTIFTGAHPDFKRSGSYANFHTLMRTMYHSLGKVQSSKNKYVKEIKGDGETLSIQQKTTFKNGIGLETFLFSIDDGEAVLAGYKISSSHLDEKLNK